MNKPMYRTAHMTRMERTAAGRRLRQVVGRRLSVLLFLIAKNLLFWGSLALSGFAIYALMDWII